MSDGDDWKNERPREPRRVLEVELKRLLDAEPFVPFTLTMNSGSQVRVTFPLALDIKKSIGVVLTPRRGTTIIRIAAIEMIQVDDA